MFSMSIPQISDEEVMKRYEQIKPVITVNGKLYHFREFFLEEIRNNGYLWNRAKDIREEVTPDELEVIPGQYFVCLHTYAYYGLFKPTICEILSQIKESNLSFVRAFEIIDSPQTANDFFKDSFRSIALDNGFHVSVVRLYRKKLL